ncbi:serine hydrolase domain-containing protein [Paenibacillus luteus]|uniref:serine hydrolase domain-containing protein n=1 Tax=Paenibacillus luteus TaxID=2545753 RepID=UPI0019D6AA38|nr:serine hydrolase domain-containing protein [Paenibacillus luteus]
MSNELMHRELDEYCTSLAQADRLNGCVLVASEGRIMLSKGYGMADFVNRIPNVPQTIFRIGSMGDQFIAMAVMIMQELKLISVDHPVSKYLPTVPHIDEITIHQLLSYTSGLYDQSSYSLLRDIIERITGRACEDYIFHAIFKPLGMINSGYGIPNDMYSTIEDLYLWGLALHTQRQISEQAYLRMTTPYKAQYGYGLFIEQEEMLGRSRKVIGHTESESGFMSIMKHYKHVDLTVIILSNQAAAQAHFSNILAERYSLVDDLAEQITEHLRVPVSYILHAAAKDENSLDRANHIFNELALACVPYFESIQHVPRLEQLYERLAVVSESGRRYKESTVYYQKLVYLLRNR